MSRYKEIDIIMPTRKMKHQKISSLRCQKYTQIYSSHDDEIASDNIKAVTSLRLWVLGFSFQLLKSTRKRKKPHVPCKQKSTEYGMLFTKNLACLLLPSITVVR